MSRERKERHSLTLSNKEEVSFPEEYLKINEKILIKSSPKRRRR